MDFYYLLYIGVLGLIIGSFLNVVIYRLPIMLHQEWQREYERYAIPSDTKPTPFNLFIPPSHCTLCQKQVPIWANIPLLGYLFLKGKCLFCHKAIALRYPLIELTTAMVSVVVVWHFGWHWQSLSALVLSWGLIALTIIDMDQQLLPDAITLPLLWLGLGVSLLGLHVSSQEAILGAALGYLSLWAIAKLFKIICKKEGMGQGDFKLLAALGAWLGWQLLPALLLIASLLGLTANAYLLNKPYRDFRHLSIPFGPYLSLAGWILLLFGQPIMHAYYRLVMG